MPAPVAFAGGVVLGAAATAAVLSTAGRVPTWRRTNYRGREVVLTGIGTGLAAIAGAVLVAATDEPGGSALGAAAAVAAGAAVLLGLVDDLRGDAGVKGLRGHLTALARGRLTSGGAKLVGIAVAGVVAGAVLRDGVLDVLLSGALVAGCANLANLLDLRPGRALKVLVVAAACAAPGAPEAVAGLSWWLVGTCLAALPFDLRERTMLGDAGANALGAAVGVVVVARAGDGVAGPVTLAVVVAATLLSEVVSYSRVIERVPPLRWADGLGRMRDDVRTAGSA